MRSTKLVMAIAMVLAGATAASATTYIWDGGDGTSQLWSHADNWDATGVPTSASDTTVRINGVNNVGVSAGHLNQDIASPFVLNRLESIAGTSGLDPTVHTYIAGSPLQFVVNGSTNPSLYGSRKGTTHLYNNMEFNAPKVTISASTWNLNFYGALSGSAQIFYDGDLSGGMDLSNSSNSFTGGVHYHNTRGTGAQWGRFRVTTSNGLGTGLVTLEGGNTAEFVDTPSTNRPGGFILQGNGISFANNFTLLADSPIFAGQMDNNTPTAGVNATLTGSIDADGHLLHLRGTGNGTANAITSTAAGGRVKKMDAGAWTLTGASTYDGSTTVTGGTLSVDGSLANSNITVTGGTFDGAGTLNYNVNGATADLITLAGGTLDISSLTLGLNLTNATEQTYVVVDYSAGGTLITATNSATDNTFAGLTGSGYYLVHDVANQQIVLTAIPAPAAIWPAALGLAWLAGRRR